MQKEGFSGLDGRTSIFDWCKVPALEHPDPKVLARYEDILFWSKHPAFSQGGTYDLCYCQSEGFDKDRHFAFARAWEHESFLVIANFGHTQEITVHIPEEAQQYLGVQLAQTEFKEKVPEKDYVLVKLS